jgi:hypothetical protein
MKRTKKQLQEEAVRLLIRKRVRERLKEGAGGAPEAEEEEAAADASTEPETEEEPADEPKKPEPEEAQDEPGLEEELAELTDLYIKKLKNAQAAVDQSDVIEIIAQLIDSFGYGNQDKLTVLQGVKEMTIR